MENSSNASSSQGRFLIAAVLSLLVLFGWQYFFAPKKPAGDANTNANVSVATAAPATPAPTQAPAPEQPQQTAAVTPDNTPARTITISAPLYEVKIDSKGALATSWIIKKNGSLRGDFDV